MQMSFHGTPSPVAHHGSSEFLAETTSLQFHGTHDYLKWMDSVGGGECYGMNGTGIVHIHIYIYIYILTPFEIIKIY